MLSVVLLLTAAALTAAQLLSNATTLSPSNATTLQSSNTAAPSNAATTAAAATTALPSNATRAATTTTAPANATTTLPSNATTTLPSNESTSSLATTGTILRGFAAWTDFETDVAYTKFRNATQTQANWVNALVAYYANNSYPTYTTNAPLNAAAFEEELSHVDACMRSVSMVDDACDCVAHLFRLAVLSRDERVPRFDHAGCAQLCSVQQCATQHVALFGDDLNRCPNPSDDLKCDSAFRSCLMRNKSACLCTEARNNCERVSYCKTASINEWDDCIQLCDEEACNTRESFILRATISSDENQKLMEKCGYKSCLESAWSEKLYCGCTADAVRCAFVSGADLSPVLKSRCIAACGATCTDGTTKPGQTSYIDYVTTDEHDYDTTDDYYYSDDDYDYYDDDDYYYNSPNYAGIAVGLSVAFCIIICLIVFGVFFCARQPSGQSGQVLDTVYQVPQVATQPQMAVPPTTPAP